jgi:microcompartment protein CcmL/EutN
MADPHLDPALALIELDSIAAGIAAGDASAKASPIGSIYTGTVHPGKYLVLISGDTASVEEGLDAGLAVGSGAIVDSVFLPDIHPAVAIGIHADEPHATFGGEALGIVETRSVAALLRAADAGMKAAEVRLGALRIADDLGGKGYVLFHGAVADVEAAVEAATVRARDELVQGRVIAQLHHEMATNLVRELQFMARVVRRPAEREA